MKTRIYVKEKAAAVLRFLDRPQLLFAAWVLSLTTPSQAQSQGLFGNVVTVFCSAVGPLVGPKSQMMSLVLIVVMAVFLVMWWLNESKEGMVIWILRTGAVISVLVNIFNIPQYLGMAAVSC